MPDNPWVTHDSSVAYENPWIRVQHHEVSTPGGSAGIYGVVQFKNRAVGVVPIDEDDHTWLVGQYRYATESYSWEIPEGGCPAAESPEQAARRELLEETGLAAGTITPLFSGIHLSNSVTDEAAWGFVATDLVAGDATPDDTEELQIQRLPVGEAIEMVLDGRINDALSVLVLLHLHADRTRAT